MSGTATTGSGAASSGMIGVSATMGAVAKGTTGTTTGGADAFGTAVSGSTVSISSHSLERSISWAMAGEVGDAGVSSCSSPSPEEPASPMTGSYRSLAGKVSASAIPPNLASSMGVSRMNSCTVEVRASGEGGSTGRAGTTGAAGTTSVGISTATEPVLAACSAYFSAASA